MGATIKNLVNNAEKSVAGIADITGVMIRELPDDCYAKKAGFQRGDVIVGFNGEQVHDVEDLLRAYKAAMGKNVEVIVTGNPIKKTFRFVVK